MLFKLSQPSKAVLLVTAVGGAGRRGCLFSVFWPRINTHAPVVWLYCPKHTNPGQGVTLLNSGHCGAGSALQPLTWVGLVPLHRCTGVNKP